MRGPAALLATLLLACAGRCAARRAHVDGRQLIVDGEPFLVKGICYSPTPINGSVYFAPYGDYFTAEYSFIWLRDLPLIKAMGANVLRTYGWQPSNDHSAFLDAVADHGLYVMATYYTGEASETSVLTAKDRAKAVAGFKREVAKYADHHALLFWSFGNELNGVWNGFLTQIGKDPEQPQCHWDERYDDLGGCWIHQRKTPWPEGSPCYEAAHCVYTRLFGWLNDAAKAAHEVADVLVISGFADVDNLYEKVGRVGHVAPDVDAWTAQVYRGISFGNFFEAMGNNTDKPVLLTEYGVDAYHDACGSGDVDPCYNKFEDTIDYIPTRKFLYQNLSYVDGDAQAEFAVNLTGEIVAASSAGAECKDADHTTLNGKCTCIGGFLMSWTDEFWKGAKSQASCTPTIDDPTFSERHCQKKAHVTCGNWNSEQHDLCGYWLESAPDHYVNEEWFGITSPTVCASHAADALAPREIYWRMRELWSGRGHDDSLFQECDDMLMGHCIALGDGGQNVAAWLFDIFGDQVKGNTSGLEQWDGALPCSGRGTCTTDWRECGAGSSSDIATPCCSCVTGFAGLGCGEIDARVYVGLGAAAILAGLLLLMLLKSLFSAIRWRVRKPELSEHLLS